MARVILVTGGARSGKSRFAERRLAEVAPPPWTYVATAEARDEEMRARIARHQEARAGRGFVTVEEPRDVARVLGEARGGVLVDCVTLWLTNRMLDAAAPTDEALLDEADVLGRAARAAVGPVVLVTNEVGAGIVPESALGRRYRDVAGLVNQRLAAHADEVVLVACGLPLRLK
jgi:adenosylcobinamide kinase/adenosylcobinamide-phosphate guanylyltransferase